MKDFQKENMKIVIVGHVDHGKSTLIGRLFYDTNSLPEGKFEKIQNDCKKRGMEFEWSFLTDALQSERNQGITIDVSQVYFKTDKRNYIIIDAPGHKEFLKNMISGATASEAAILVIDAKEGIKEHSKKHGYLLSLLDIKQVIVAINKIDLIDYDEKKFDEIKEEYLRYLKNLGVVPNYVIPISARNGDFIATNSQKFSWYKGPTILQALDLLKKSDNLDNLPLRFPVQDVYKFDEKRIIVGRIESGKISVGDKIIFSPSNKEGVVNSIEFFGAKNPITVATSGMSIGITLKDQIFIERGEIISHENDLPKLNNLFAAKIFWLGNQQLEMSKTYKLKMSTGEYVLHLHEIKKIINTEDLSEIKQNHIAKNQIAEVVFRIRGLAPFDNFSSNPKTGRFVIIDDSEIAGGGIIKDDALEDQRHVHRIKSKNLSNEEDEITYLDRVKVNCHKGGILWLTGLSGSGKSTIARELQKEFFRRGIRSYILDGDNIRKGLSSDLGFSPQDRSENIRRVSEVAKLFADAGHIVITAFISPYSKDRHFAKAIAPNFFHNIYIKADLEDCRKRDPKGLYKKAQNGEIKDLTGIGDVYEEPADADLIIDTSKNDIAQSVEMLLQYSINNFIQAL